jgi:2-C-methyl-D-erythritol 4-phosphate cytidylyltransferase
MRVIALLLAAGRGRRLGGDGAKCLLELSGRPLLAYSVDAVEAASSVEAFVVAAPSSLQEDAKRAASSSKLLAVVPGGETRQASVRSALAAVPEPFEAVVCHDVARPFAGPELFDRTVAALEWAEGAIPAVGLADTVKLVEDGAVRETLPRDRVVAVQTPQAFRRRALEEAHHAASRDGLEATDDAALLERAGFRVVTVEGHPSNRKITVPEDLRWAEAVVRERAGG